MTEFPENSTIPCFILQDQWIIYKKRYKLPAFLLNSQFNCMLYVAQVNKSENGYLAHVLVQAVPLQHNLKNLPKQPDNCNISCYKLKSSLTLYLQ